MNVLPEVCEIVLLSLPRNAPKCVLRPETCSAPCWPCRWIMEGQGSGEIGREREMLTVTPKKNKMSSDMGSETDPKVSACVTVNQNSPKTDGFVLKFVIKVTEFCWDWAWVKCKLAYQLIVVLISSIKVRITLKSVGVDWNLCFFSITFGVINYLKPTYCYTDFCLHYRIKS